MLRYAQLDESYYSYATQNVDQKWLTLEYKKYLQKVVWNTYRLIRQSFSARAITEINDYKAKECIQVFKEDSQALLCVCYSFLHKNH